MQRCDAVRAGLCVLFALGSAMGCSVRWNARTQAEVDARLLWSKPLKERIFYIDTRQGLVVADAGKSRDGVARGEGERFLLHSSTGALLWHGPQWKAWPLSGMPHPVIVESGEGSFAIAAFSDEGEPRWRSEFPGRLVVGATAPARDLAVILSVASASGEDGLERIPAQLRALSLSDGRVRWTEPVGPVQGLEHTLGNVWRTTGDLVFIGSEHVFLLLDGSVYAIPTATGRTRWRSELPDAGEADLTDRPLWRPLERDVVLSIGNQLARLSPDAGVVWTHRLGDEVFVHGLEATDEGVVVGLRTPGEEGAVLVDAGDGRERWRRLNGREKTFFLRRIKVSPDGIAVGGDRVFFASHTRLNALDFRSGQPIFREKVESGYAVLLGRSDRCVLLDSRRIEARAMADGAELWKHGPYKSPLERWSEDRMGWTAILGANLLATTGGGGLAASGAQIGSALGSGRSHYTLASQRLAQNTRDMHNVWDSDTRISMLETAQTYGAIGAAQERSAASAQFASSVLSAGASLMAGLATAAAVPTPWLANPRQEAFFLQIASRWGKYEQAVVVAVDLDTGLERRVPLPVAGANCMPVFVVDDEAGIALEAFQKLPFCGDSGRVSALRISR